MAIAIMHKRTTFRQSHSPGSEAKMEAQWSPTFKWPNWQRKVRTHRKFVANKLFYSFFRDHFHSATRDTVVAHKSACNKIFLYQLHWIARDKRWFILVAQTILKIKCCWFWMSWSQLTSNHCKNNLRRMCAVL